MSATSASASRDAEDARFLLASGRATRGTPAHEFLVHLDQPVGVWNYIRIANEMTRRFGSGRVLDWGCGFGQMSYLLARRGFDVVSYDVGPADAKLPDVPLTHAVTIQRTTHPTTLPFAEATFDVVLSCGVLEHVDEFSQPGNEQRSLEEIHRVLKPRGYFSIYQLPQQLAWQEAVARKIRLGYSHPRRFTENEIVAQLGQAGFVVDGAVFRNNLLPKNVTGLPEAVRDLYGSLGRILLDLDKTLSAIPGLNRFAGVLELTARRAD